MQLYLPLITVLTILLGQYNAQIVSKTIILNNGVECPILGLGNNERQPDVAKQMVFDALDVGYRHIDTAAFYENEKAVGQVVNELIRRGKIRRQELFITTKIFLKDYPETKHRQHTIQAVQLALQKLNLDYIDLVLIHYPSDDPLVNSEIWSGLEESLEQRLVRSIGVSNFNVEQLAKLVETARVVPQMNQIRSNPKENNNEIIDYCKRFGIQVTAYSPLGKGKLISDPTIVEIGNRHNKTGAQVIIRWHLQRGVVAIPKSTKKDRIRENFNVWDFSLTEDDMKALNLINSSSVQAMNIVLNLFLLFVLIFFKSFLLK